MEPKKPDHSEDEEIARQRDEVIRRMANTPPQPKSKREPSATPKKLEHPTKKVIKKDRDP